MVNKKYLLLAGLCSVMAAQPAFSQESGTQTAQWSSRDMTYRGESYDVLDSSYVPGYRLEQHRRYLNHQYAFPAKPRNMWEIGVGGGLFNVLGDVSTGMLWNKGAGDGGGGFGFHAHVRKAWGYFLSTRLQYIYGVAKGMDYEATPNTEMAREAAWNGVNNGFNYATATPSGTVAPGVFRNYRMESHQLNFDLIGSIYNVRFHKAKTGMSVYGFVGVGALLFNTRVNAVNEAAGTPWNFNAAYDAQFTSGSRGTGTAGDYEPYENKGKVWDAVVGEVAKDNTYETEAMSAGAKAGRPEWFNKQVAFTPSLGAGVQFRLSKRLNLSIEDRISMTTGEDNLDGHRWSDASTLSQSTDAINYLSLGLNFNLGNARKNVEPLYWVNPLDHAYNELSYPRHMMLPAPVLPDSDNDGITDQFDRCPGTPAGVAVDAHGCPMDTDGDGVPDDRDKQLITPTECQPVDADGVGKCPCPDGCGSVATACSNIGAGNVAFDNNASRIRPAAQSQLATLAAQMQANPTCKVVIMGAGNGSKAQQQRSWDRVNAIIEYMSEKHAIDRNRFIFQYGQAGDANGVMYRSAVQGEEGPANVAPPFPNLRRD